MDFGLVFGLFIERMFYICLGWCIVLVFVFLVVCCFVVVFFMLFLGNLFCDCFFNGFLLVFFVCVVRRVGGEVCL